MAEVEKIKEDLELETPNEDVDIELEGEVSEAEKIRDRAEIIDEFYENIALKLSDEVLGRMSSELVQEYKRDKVSRKDWETGYTKGLDLLGFKYTEMTRPFKGSASVTHPLLAEAVTQFQAQAYKELIPSDGPVRAQVVGAQSDEKVNQATRVQEFFNYMLLEKMEEYTPDMGVRCQEDAIINRLILLELEREAEEQEMFYHKAKSK